MTATNATLDVVVIGAGSAGLAAAKALAGSGCSWLLVEASHRIGGRAYTETVGDGMAFDLGCHWMHSASLNPYVAIAEDLGFEYNKDPFGRRLHLDDGWAGPQLEAERDAFFTAAHEQIDASKRAGRDVSVADVTPRDSRWTALFDYWMSIYVSADSDQVSALDLANYRDTEENWPLKRGYGALIARFGADVPVSLNTAVETVDWSGPEVVLRTRKGEISARRVIVTVSTGILGAGDIRFSPTLPVDKQEAIAALPLGNHNRICLVFDRDVFGPDIPNYVSHLDGSSEPMGFSLRPFGYNYAVGFTGGRFATWLERAGTEASADLATQNLVKVFGSEIARRIVGHNVTAWAGDPWVKGAYSAALPGCHHQRAVLGRAVDDRLFFAGEATSTDFFSTAHGAYLTGQRAAGEALASLT